MQSPPSLLAASNSSVLGLHEYCRSTVCLPLFLFSFFLSPCLSLSVYLLLCLYPHPLLATLYPGLPQYSLGRIPAIHHTHSLASLDADCHRHNKVDLSRSSSKPPGLGEGCSCVVGMLRFGRMKKKTKAEERKKEAAEDHLHQADHDHLSAAATAAAAAETAPSLLSSSPDLTAFTPARVPSVSLPHVDSQLSMHQHNELFDHSGLAEEDSKGQHPLPPQEQSQGHEPQQNGSSTAVATDCSTLNTGEFKKSLLESCRVVSSRVVVCVVSLTGGDHLQTKPAACLYLPILRMVMRPRRGNGRLRSDTRRPASQAG